MTNESLKRPNYLLYKVSRFFIKKQTNNFNIIIKNRTCLSYTTKNSRTYLRLKGLLPYSLRFEPCANMMVTEDLHDY